ncbi:nectin-1-like isoform X2 [Epinephelus fuscoguttatus]|uniref:nectin-1-like isoform X2 n=1 Tax=Epinephelus fuscoguttatus TaxID=293821 RepID=UPI0020D04F56|nr:nectin-1-like isoform X2 [Epinephelus fuscoguttatus]
MRTMKTCSRSPLLLLWFIHVTIPVLEAQEVKVSSTVTGYLGHDVTLPCTFIQGAQHADITQVQWELKPPEGENIVLIVFNVNFGVSVYNTFLKDRVELEEQSLIVRDVQMTDAGSYTCSIATFPSGSFEGTTNLVVQGGKTILPRMIAAGVFVLIVSTMLVTTYFIIIRIRREVLVEHRVCYGKFLFSLFLKSTTLTCMAWCVFQFR